MENSGYQHFNQGIKVKITNINNVDITYPLTWRVHYCFSLQPNHDKTGKPKLRHTLQSPIEVPGLEPRAHTTSTLVRRGMEARDMEVSSFWKDMHLPQCWLDRYFTAWDSLLQCSMWLESTYLCLRAFSKVWRYFCLCWPKNTLPSFLHGPQWMTKRSRYINIPLISFSHWAEVWGGKGNTGTCSSLASRVPLWDWALTAHWQLIDNVPLLTAFPSLSHFLTPLFTFPGIISQLNYLHLIPCLRVCFWENLT